MEYDFSLLGELIIKGYEETPTISVNGTQIRIDDIGGVCVVTIVGSNEDLDWKRNFDFRKVESDYFPGLVHRGFLEAFEAGREELISAIYGKRQNRVPFVVQGHSQGGATAQLYAYHMQRVFCDVKRVVLWADPRVGNKVFAKDYDMGLGDMTTHIIRQGDPVPLVPFASLGYRRTGGTTHYWTIDGEMEGKQSLLEMIKDDLWAWTKWRLSGNFDLASDNYHSFRDYAGLYE